MVTSSRVRAGMSLALLVASTASIQKPRCDGAKAMQARNPEQRLTMLEEQMQALKDLPGRVTVLESQILQLRTEMTDGFSALRDDLRAELHGAAKGLETGLRTELHATRDTLRSEIHAVRDELRGALHGLSADVKKGVEETQSLVKLLHEHTLLEIGKLRRPDVP